MKKMLLGTIALIAVAAICVGFTTAYFTDTATSTDNNFTTGTIDLTVEGNPSVMSIALDNMKPGDVSVYYKWVLKNTGSLPGKLSVSFGNAVNLENGINRPEQVAENDPYADPNNGELGQYLKPGKHPDLLSAEVLQYVTWIDRNDQEGWYIIELSEEIDTNNSMGFGPKTWSVPSQVISVFSTGPQHPWGTPGLNGLMGNTYKMNGVLAPGAETCFFFRVSLDDNLRRWDGTKWIDDVNDNIIQSDSVQFDITFRLDQLVP